MNSHQKKIEFPGRRRGEKVNLFFRRHPLSFFGFGFLAFIMFALPLIVFVLLINNGLLIFETAVEPKIAVALVSVYLLFVLSVAIVGWMNFYLDVYIVTDRRLIDIHQIGLFSRNLSEVDLTDVEDVKADVEGFLPTYFNFGTVDVQTAGKLQNIQFTDVPEPYKLARKIMDYHEGAVRQQSQEAVKKAAQETEQKKKEIKDGGVGEIEFGVAPKSTEINEIDNQSESLEEEKSLSKAKDNSNGTIEKNDLDEGGEIDL